MTFIAVFLAEVGDKTQISVVSFTASGRSPLTVFIAASLALVAATLVGVFVGSWIAKYVDLKHLQVASGVLFIAIGIWTLLKS